MRAFFRGGYACNIVFYVAECLLVLFLMLKFRKLHLCGMAAFIVVASALFILLYRGKKKKPLKETVHMRMQALAFIFVHVFMSLALDSAQVFIYAMCLSSVTNFIFIDVKQAIYHLKLSFAFAVMAAVFIFFYTGSTHTMIIFTFGIAILVIMNWVMLSITHVISFQNRQNMEQERSLDDLLKVVEAKCDEAQSATRSKTRFLANMSHEIRTPINSVLGMNEMILRESTEENILGYSGEVKTAAESLLGIINDILDITKIEEGRLTLVNVKYNLAQIICDVHNLIKFRAEAKNLRFEVAADSNLPTMLIGDDIRLKQILTNLLTNAVKYTHNGGIRLEIKYLGGGKISFSVIDTGIGIKQEDIANLFDAFNRAEETRNRSIEGTGLGLNITVNLLKMLGSRLEVSSEYGKGSTFSFVLEQKILDEKPIGVLNLALRQQEQTKYNASFEAPDAKILVVDDNEMNRKVLKNLLKKTKIQITEASGGRECLSLTSQQHFDLIFMDHMMPEMDGIEAFKLLRADPQNLCVETPVVVLTANAVVGAKSSYMREGFDGFLSKPIQPEILEKMVCSMLDKSLVTEGSAADDAPAAVSAELPLIEGVDWGYARLHLSDDEMLLDTVKMFSKALKPDMTELDSYFADIESDEAVDSYRIKVHSMKSSAALIGIVPLAGMALELERAARSGNRDMLKALHPVFSQIWLSYQQPLSELFDNGTAQETTAAAPEEIRKIFAEIRAAAEDMDIDALDKLSARLDGYQFSDTQAKQIDEIKAQILNFDVEKLMVCEFA